MEKVREHLCGKMTKFLTFIGMVTFSKLLSTHAFGSHINFNTGRGRYQYLGSKILRLVNICGLLITT